MYVIYNHAKKCYVARPGSQLSFTRSLAKARRYSSLDAARADCCGNESVQNIADKLYELPKGVSHAGR